MVSCALRLKGIEAHATDISCEGLDSRALRDGVRFAEMDSASLDFADSRFDLVFSYGVMEHVADPAAVLREAARVVRPGGCIYMAIGPLYYSPWGLHAFDVINVPYCHILFARSTLDSYVASRKLGTIGPAVNGWALEEYHQLWRRMSDDLAMLGCREIPDPRRMGMIRRFPSCFRSTPVGLEDFTVSHLEILFQKT